MKKISKMLGKLKGMGNIPKVDIVNAIPLEIKGGNPQIKTSVDYPNDKMCTMKCNPFSVNLLIGGKKIAEAKI